MLNHFIPDYIFDSIYQITPALLQENEIRGILLDLDGTMVSSKNREPSQELKDFLRHMKRAGITVVVLSNNSAKRVREFCDQLDVPYVSGALKPLKRGFLTGAEKLGLPLNQIAMVGDQVFTDIYGGHHVGAMTIFVRSIDRHRLWIRMRYQLERPFLRCGQKQMEKGAK